MNATKPDYVVADLSLASWGEKEIKIAAGKASSKVVKPGYKRKVRIAVERVKARHRRKVIKRDIRRQQVERYKSQAKESKE